MARRGTTLSPWRDVPYEDNLTTGVLHFDRANKRLLMLSSIGRETAAYFWHDWATGHDTLVAEHPKSDCWHAVLHPETFEVEAVSINAARQQWIYVDPGVAGDFASLQTRLAGFEFYVESKSDDNRRWIVMADKAEQPATYFLSDRDQQSITELFRARPALISYRLAPMHSVHVKARDGLDLVSYLTLPANIGGDRPPEPLPMVLPCMAVPGPATFMAIIPTTSGLQTGAMRYFRSTIAAPQASANPSSQRARNNTRPRCMTI